MKDDQIVVEAKEHKFSKPRKAFARWYALAASFILVVGIGGYLLLGGGMPYAPGGGGGGGGGGTGGGGFGERNPDGSTIFNYYAGPVFSLSFLGDVEGITASRDIVFDFSRAHFQFRDNDIRITDSYILTNETADDKTVKVIYPFNGRFADLSHLIPSITAGGIALETELKAGVYSGGFMSWDGTESVAANIKPINSWEGYRALLSNGEYLKRALGNIAELNQIVTVYEFVDPRVEYGAGTAPTLAAEFSLDFDKTKIMTFGFNGADAGNGYIRQSFFVERRGYHQYVPSPYMIVIGDDISNFSIQGYQNGGLQGKMDGVTADVVRHEATLGSILADLLYKFIPPYYEDNRSSAGYSGELPDMIMLYRAAVELLCDYGILSDNVAFRYQYGMLEEIFMEVLVMDRVFYLTAEIGIPAGGSVELRADMIKPGSFLYPGFGSPEALIVYGYDMLTQLDPSLTFNSLTAGISGTNRIEIVRQNFGFDIRNGISNLTLDSNVPHYYLEVSGR